VEERLSGQKEEFNAPLEEILTSEVMSTVTNPETNTFKAAVPLAGGVLTNHFGHCEKFAVVQVFEGQIGATELHVPPPHEPGVLPRWLGDLGVNLIIAGGMGQRALGLFAEQGIKVITGAPNLEPEVLVQQYLAGVLVTGSNVCDH
jgi:predicted Fe-Mo cluster-binding NifX family protein